MGRKPKIEGASAPKETAASKKKAEKATNFLLECLEFIGLVKGEDTTALFRNGQLVATNGTVTIGVPINAEITACPNLEKLTRALQICGSSFQLTHLSPTELAVSNGKFHATIPCIEPAASPAASMQPDLSCAPLTPAFLASLTAVGIVATEGAARMVEASILCRSGSVVATNGKILVEHTHGIDFPQIVLPKASSLALAKTSKEPVSFGVGWDVDRQINSITFYFADKSWLKTQLYREAWPDFDGLFSGQLQWLEIPPEFYAAVRNVAPFADDKETIFVSPALARTDVNTEKGAKQVIPGGYQYWEAQFNSVLLGYTEGPATHFAYAPDTGRLYFWGNNYRAVVMAKT